jgi:hypothetical protein
MSSNEPCWAMATRTGWWFAAALIEARRYDPGGSPPFTVALRTPFLAGEFTPVTGECCQQDGIKTMANLDAQKANLFASRTLVSWIDLSF